MKFYDHTYVNSQIFTTLSSQQRQCLTFHKHSKNVVAICRLALAQFKLVHMSEGADVPILQDPPLS